MKSERAKTRLLIAEILLPAVPGLWTTAFGTDAELLTPRMLIPAMLCINLAVALLFWRRLGASRRQRLDTLMLMAFFTLLPWMGYWLLPAGLLGGRLWLQVGWYCLGQLCGYLAIIVVPDRYGHYRQQRYEQRVLSGREKFESRREVMAARAREAAVRTAARSDEKKR